jgi:DNA-binding transcriptional regulator YhcF (GntR family)
METDVQRPLLEKAVGSQYEILRLLGQGGMGSVYLARERLLERLVAVKVLRSELVYGDARERFIREARTAAKLTHPHIVPLYSFGQADDTLFYIMGFVEGESLEDRLKRSRRLNPPDARRILAELADALEYAHNNAVIHRDIKPDNILIDRGSGRAILTDFGIAKVSAGGATITRTGIIVGTPLYMSPEQAAGDREIDGRTDLYSLGVIGYRMLTGRLPFEGDTIQDVFVKQATQPPPPIDTLDGDIPIELVSAVMRCLEKDPSRRWPTAAVFQRALIAEDELAPPARTGRAMFAPPALWRGWWPEGLRHSGDLWPRLPIEVRRARTMTSAFRVGLVAMLAITAIAVMHDVGVGARSAATTALAIATVLFASVTGLAARASTATVRGLLRRHQIADAYLRRLLLEPTIGSKLWRHKDLEPLPSTKAARPTNTIDSGDEQDYSATTPVHFGMFDHIDPRSPTPLYAQIATRIRVGIAAGELEPGEVLPSVRSLAAKLRINPATVVQAYRDLETEGLVSTRHGAGTFVQQVAPDRRKRDRTAEARRLVRELLAQAGSLGITATELRSAVDEELNGGKR